MQNSGIWAVLCQIIRRSVIKSYPDGENHIRVMHRHIGFVGAVHSQHAQRLTMRCRKCLVPINEETTGRFNASTVSFNC